MNYWVITLIEMVYIWVKKESTFQKSKKKLGMVQEKERLPDRREDIYEGICLSVCLSAYLCVCVLVVRKLQGFS